MDWKAKINTVFFCCIICLLAASAITLTVSSEAEAQQKLGTNVELVAGNCKVVEIKNEYATGELVGSKNYEVNYVFHYAENGQEKELFGGLQTRQLDSKFLEGEIAKGCERIWANLQAHTGKIDKIEVKPSNSILNRAYSVITKQWANITAQG